MISSPQYGDETQCLGYASIISDLLFGYDAPITEFYDFDELRIGDHIRMGWYEHSMIVTDIDWDTDTITVTEVKCRLRKLPDPGVDKSPAASFSAWKATLPITRAMQIENRLFCASARFLMSFRGTFYISQKLYDTKTPRTTQNRSGCAIQRINYLTMLATSLAKSSFLFSRPSPFSKRTKSVTFIAPPAFLLPQQCTAQRRGSPFFNERLLQEAVVLIKLADSAVTIFSMMFCGFLEFFRIVLDLSHEDFFFLIGASANRGLIEVSGSSGNLHCDVLAALVENFCGTFSVSKTNENARFCRRRVRKQRGSPS